MFNKKTLTVLPCTVKIIDRRDSTEGEDLCLLTNLEIDWNGFDLTTEDGKNERHDVSIDCLTDKYGALGYQVTDVVFGEPQNLTVDLLQEAVGRIRVAGSVRNERL